MELSGAVDAGDEDALDVGGFAGARDDGEGALRGRVVAREEIEKVGEDLGSPDEGDVDGWNHEGGTGKERGAGEHE
mgnify:CR=1 FL=1